MKTRLTSLLAGSALTLSGLMINADAATQAVVDMVGEGYEGTHILTAISVDSTGTGGSAAASTDYNLISLADGSDTNWDMTINALQIDYKAHGTSDSKERGAAVTSGAAYSVFGSLGFEWNGVVRGIESSVPYIEFVFSGLSSDYFYDLAFLHNYNSGTGGNKDAIATLTNSDGTLDGATSIKATTANNDGQMILFSDIEAGVDGTFSVLIHESNAFDDFYLQGLSLTETSMIPEPSEYALAFGLLASLLFGYRRLRRK
ncbi:MAG: hypothetical protein ACQKBW_08635 [Puniceicoccales bacterium]